MFLHQEQKKHIHVSLLSILVWMLFTGCSDGLIFTTETVGIAENVTLTCSRLDERGTYLFWIRIVSGNFPEVLRGTLVYDSNEVNRIDHHFTTKQGPGIFDLQIYTTQLSDTAVYYCVKVYLTEMTFISGTFLRVKGKHSNKL